MSFYELSGGGRISLFKGNVLGSGVKDPYATAMRNSGVTAMPFTSVLLSSQQ